MLEKHLLLCSRFQGEPYDPVTLISLSMLDIIHFYQTNQMLRIKKLLDAMSIASSSASASSITLQSRSIAMMPASADPFGHEGQADLYKKYRPSYSDEQLRDVEKHLLSDMSSREWAVDLGCGTGKYLSFYYFCYWLCILASVCH